MPQDPLTGYNTLGVDGGPVFWGDYPQGILLFILQKGEKGIW